MNTETGLTFYDMPMYKGKDGREYPTAEAMFEANRRWSEKQDSHRECITPDKEKLDNYFVIEKDNLNLISLNRYPGPDWRNF